jgi:PAS domain S-box-containing protein
MKRPRAVGVLVVEDEHIIAKDISQRLEAMGYSVFGPVDTGADAIAAAARDAPDLVLMDLVLRGPMDGVEAAGIIRRQIDLPVVFLTAFGDHDTLERARVAGPHGYLLKPFEDRDLQVTIEMALERHSAERSLRESEERFRMLAETSFEGVLICRDGVVVDCNTRLCAMLGFGPAELAGKRLLDLVSSESHGRIRRHILAADDRGIELEMRRKDGTEFPAFAGAGPARLGPPGGRVMVVRDLTLQKEAEGVLRRRSTANLYGLVVSALPLVTPGAYQAVREDLVKLFADRFESFFRDGYERRRRALPADLPALEVYLSWVAELFSNFGMDAVSSVRESRGFLEMRTCPWSEYSVRNPVFCMLCRAMAGRSFSWAVPGGSLGTRGTIATGGGKCEMEFRPAGG